MRLLGKVIPSPFLTTLKLEFVFHQTHALHLFLDMLLLFCHGF
jgi:hypothetical protein